MWRLFRGSAPTRRSLAKLALGSLAGLFSWALLTVTASHAQTSDPFFKGRQMKFIVGSAGGGGYEFYSRLLTRHLGRFIPGNPTFVVQAMPGAGGAIAANYLFNIAPQDGSEIGMLGRAASTQTLLEPDNSSIKFDPQKFKWIGSPQQEVGLILVSTSSAVKALEDLKAHEVIVSGTSRMGPPSFYPRVMNGLLGTKFKVIEGYKSSQDALLALERGEVAGHASGSSAGPFRDRIMPWIEGGQVRIVGQIGLIPDKQYPDIPTVVQLATGDDQRAVLRLLFAQQVLAWPVVAPPQTPGNRVKMLREAFDRTVVDREFLDDAQKAGLMINPIGGEDIDKLLREVFLTSVEIINATRNLMK